LCHYIFSIIQKVLDQDTRQLALYSTAVVIGTKLMVLLSGARKPTLLLYYVGELFGMTRTNGENSANQPISISTSPPPEDWFVSGGKSRRSLSILMLCN
jgi:hypothetical protein